MWFICAERNIGKRRVCYMLKEVKEHYLSVAKQLPNYKKISQIELADKYNENCSQKDAYLAALILRYWNIIDKINYKDKGLYEEQLPYDWYVDAVIYALNSKAWHNPESTVYNDPKAVEKIINVCVNCSRANWFQASNRFKRKANHLPSSLESLKENYNDNYTPKTLIKETDPDNYTYYVITYFNKQQYLLSLIIDVIVSDIKMDLVKDDKSLVSQIKKSIKSLPESYSESFAYHYNLDVNKVVKSFQLIYNMNDNKLKQSIESYIYELRSILRKEFK